SFLGDHSGGGAEIANVGSLTVTGSSFESHSPNGYGNEIAVVNLGSAILDSSNISFSGNGNFDAYVTGVLNSGNITITHSTISGCFHHGIDNSGTLTLSASTVTGNGSNNPGAGIYNTGTVTLSASTVTGNYASTAGGGIYNAGALYVTNGSTVTRNVAPAA